MTKHVLTKIEKSQRARPASPPANQDAPPALPSLREFISDLRVRSDAARQQATVGLAPLGADAPMVPVFQVPLSETEVLTSDRDVVKREERIRKLLNERGPRRLLGAVAGPALAEALSDLYRSHPNFSSAIDLLLGEEQLARQRGAALCGLRILLTGKPGIGKTDLCQTLADKLGVPMTLIAMGAAQSSSALAGSEVHWGNTRPGQVWEALVQGNYANPLIVLDELEKATSHWGDPAAALFQLLESKTAAKFRDLSVPWLAINASMVNWIATVNDVSQLHEAIVSRFHVIDAEAPPEEQLRGLIQSIYTTLLDEHGLAGRYPPQLDRQSESELLSGSIRDVKRRLRAALGVALRNSTGALVIEPTRTTTSQRRIGFV